MNGAQLFWYCRAKAITCTSAEEESSGDEKREESGVLHGLESFWGAL